MASFLSGKYSTDNLTRESLNAFRSVAGAAVGEGHTRLRALLREETKATLRLAGPISATLMMDYLIGFLPTLFLGRMGALELAAGSLAAILCNTTGFSFGINLLTAVDTLSAHAFGAGKHKRMGVIAQRAFWIITLFCVPVIGVWAFAEPILQLLGQDPDVSSLAANLVLWTIPGLFAAVWFDVLMRFLQSMGTASPTTICTVLALPFDVAIMYTLVYLFELGALSSALVTSSVFWIQFLILGAYVTGARHTLRHAWPGWTRKAFRRWIPFLSLAVPGAIMGSMEGWGFDIMAVLAGNLGVIPQAAHSALVNIYLLIQMVPIGISIAANTRVAMLLGARKIRQAKLSYYIALFSCIGLLHFFASPTAIYIYIFLLQAKQNIKRPQHTCRSSTSVPFQRVRGDRLSSPHLDSTDCGGVACCRHRSD